jgi:CDGSH-type Zn-finger protein
MSKIKLLGAKNGPYLLSTVARYTDESGKENEVKGGTIALCRCGYSKNKPFCDGSHGKFNFEAPAVSLELEI